MADHYLKGANWVLENENFRYEGVLDSNGKTDLRNIALGDYKFTLSKKGYLTKTIDISVLPEPINIEVDLEPIPKPELVEETPKKKSKKRATKKSKEEKTSESEEEVEKPKKSTKKKTSKRKSTKKKTTETSDKKEEE